jgi:hypothetical protein
MDTYLASCECVTQQIALSLFPGDIHKKTGMDTHAHGQTDTHRAQTDTTGCESYSRKTQEELDSCSSRLGKALGGSDTICIFPPEPTKITILSGGTSMDTFKLSL